jgi:sirohydrochlorin cobaltochelatase
MLTVDLNSTPDLDSTSTVNPNLDPNLSQLALPPLPLPRPLLLIGHGTKDVAGRESLLEFARLYHQLDPSRPVFPCFLELTHPSIAEVVADCVAAGYTELSALPVLLFAARHNKFDVTNELDYCRQLYPQLRFHYGRHFGITPGILELWQERLAALDQPTQNPQGIPRSETVLLLVGRGSSDPDANSDVYKLARLLWEGSGYKTVETCFIGITHPRLEEGFQRARLYQPQRIVVLPHFLFTGVLVQKIWQISAEQQAKFPEITITNLPEIGLHPHLFQILRERELETQLGQVQMNCEMCKFRLAAGNDAGAHSDHHHASHRHHDHGHAHHHADHHHGHSHAAQNLDNPTDYHQRIWQVP